MSLPADAERIGGDGFSQYDAERIARAKKQLDEGKGTFHEVVEV